MHGDMHYIASPFWSLSFGSFYPSLSLLFLFEWSNIHRISQYTKERYKNLSVFLKLLKRLSRFIAGRKTFDNPLQMVEGSECCESYDAQMQIWYKNSLFIWSISNPLDRVLWNVCLDELSGYLRYTVYRRRCH